MATKRSAAAGKGTAGPKAGRAKASTTKTAKRVAKDVAPGIMTEQSVLVSLTPTMSKALRDAMQVRGGVTVRLEPVGKIRLGRILRAYPVVEPPN